MQLLAVAARKAPSHAGAFDEALRQFGERPVVRRGVVEAMTREESAMVQIALIDLAVDLREKESVNALRQLTQNAKLDEAVRERAQKGLAELE